MKKRILTILLIVAFVSFGVSMRQDNKNLFETDIKQVISDYKKAQLEIVTMEKELKALKDASKYEGASYEELLTSIEKTSKEFEEYKEKFPESITNEIESLTEENTQYKDEVNSLEKQVVSLSNQVKQQQVVSSGSSTSGSSGSNTNSGTNQTRPSTNNNTNSSNTTSPKPNANQGGVGTVYANGGSSKSNKYHRTPTAHNMEGSIAMTKQQAEASGYVPCGRCY